MNNKSYTIYEDVDWHNNEDDMMPHMLSIKHERGHNILSLYREIGWDWFSDGTVNFKVTLDHPKNKDWSYMVHTPCHIKLAEYYAGDYRPAHYMVTF